MNQRDEKEMITQAIKNFSGYMPTLEGAIGAYFTGKEIGWRPLLLIHEKRTLKKYEDVLGISFRDELPEEGRWARKSLAWRSMERVTNFWKAVKGEIPGIRSPELR